LAITGNFKATEAFEKSLQPMSIQCPLWSALPTQVRHCGMSVSCQTRKSPSQLIKVSQQRCGLYRNRVKFPLEPAFVEALFGHARHHGRTFHALGEPSATQTHVRFALAVTAVLLIAFAVTLPFRNILLPPFAPSIAILQTAITINDLITAVLLYSQFSIVRQRGLLILASGYLYSALIVIPYSLTFPGVYAPTGLLGAGLQTTSWLYWCWHLGLPFAIIAYAMLKDADRKIAAAEGPASPVIALECRDRSRVSMRIGFVGDCGRTVPAEDPVRRP
jgi:hypothetical protein